MRAGVDPVQADDRRPTIGAVNSATRASRQGFSEAANARSRASAAAFAAASSLPLPQPPNASVQANRANA
jgi:hypothetical protein